MPEEGNRERDPRARGTNSRFYRIMGARYIQWQIDIADFNGFTTHVISQRYRRARTIAKMGSFNDFVPESYLCSMPTIVRRLESTRTINDPNFDNCSFREILISRRACNSDVPYWDRTESLNVFALNRIDVTLHKHSDIRGIGKNRFIWERKSEYPYLIWYRCNLSCMVGTPEIPETRRKSLNESVNL